MHLSYGPNKEQRKRLWEYATKNNMIGLDIPDIVTRNWASLSPREQESAGRHWKRQFNLFCGDMHTGDYVVILNGIFFLLGIGKITEPYHQFDRSLSDPNNPDRFFDHFRKNIRWIKKQSWEGCPLPQPLVFDGTLDRVTPKTRSPRWKVLTAIHL
jgi:hypothetical protein